MIPNTIYQIYLRTFTKEGTLKAAEKKLSYIADIGIDTVYLSALNKEETSLDGQSERQLASGLDNPKNPYRIIDFFDVDDEYGTIEDLKDFVKTAHSYGLQVLIDLVYLHCGMNAVFLKDHPDFVIRNSDGSIKVGADWPFARFDFDNLNLRNYLWSNMEFFIRDIDADGFRCDCGSSIPLDFWKVGVERIKKIKPDVFMLNEGCGDEYLSVFDANYYADLGYWYAIDKIFAYEENSGKNIKLDELAYHIHEEVGTKYDCLWFKNQRQKLYNDINSCKILNTWENHDNASDLFDNRLEKLIGNEGCDAILVLLFTLNGIPFIYNGNEVADDSRKSMFWNRFCEGDMSVQWKNLNTKAGQNRLNLVKELIKLRKKHSSLSDGKLVWLEGNNPKNLLCFSRVLGEEKINVVVNVTAKAQSVTLNEIESNSILMSHKCNIDKNEITLSQYGYVISQVK